MEAMRAPQDPSPRSRLLRPGASDAMISEQYVWLLWSSAFLVPWLAAYVAFPVHRAAMVKASLFTAPFGLTEPLFVPEYWSGEKARFGQERAQGGEGQMGREREAGRVQGTTYGPPQHDQSDFRGLKNFHEFRFPFARGFQ